MQAWVIDKYGNNSVLRFTKNASFPIIHYPITNSVTQITNGLTDSLGIDMKAVLSGFLGGKVASSNATDKTTTINLEMPAPLKE